MHRKTENLRKNLLFCRVRCGDVNWVDSTARQVRSVSGLRRMVTLYATQNVNTLWTAACD